MRLQAGEGNWLKRGTVELLGLVEIFCILIIVVTCLYICQNSSNYILKIGDYSYRFWVVRLGFESWGSLRFFSILPICLILPNWQGRFHGTLTRQPALVKCFLHRQAQLMSCSTWFIFLAWNFCHYSLFFRTQCRTDPRRNWRSCEQHCETFSQTWKRGMMGYKTYYGRILKLLLYMIHKAIKRCFNFQAS